MVQSAQQTNGVDAEKLKSFNTRIDNLEAEKESERGKYMKRCREIGDEIDAVYAEMKNAGLPVKVVKAERKVAALEKKANAVRDGLDADDQDLFDAVQNALGRFGDTPLGNAALEKAKPRGMPGADTH